jgi:hypothetical protein
MAPPQTGRLAGRIVLVFRRILSQLLVNDLLHLL